MRDIVTAERAESRRRTVVSGPADRGYLSTRRWLEELQAELGTADPDRAYRVLGAWLQLVRDRLPLADAVHLGTCLPVPLRGLYYEGWEPNRPVARHDRNTFIGRFAIIARISNAHVPAAARAAWVVFQRRVPRYAEAVNQLFPEDVRRLFAGI